jgi:hypothetical protein
MITNYPFSQLKLISSLIVMALLISSTSFCQTSENKMPINPTGKSDSIKVAPDSIIKELIGGTIYFAGKNFPSVVKIRIDKSNKQMIQSCIARCVTGSTIVYENVYYKNSKGVIYGPLNSTTQMNSENMMQEPIFKHGTQQQNSPTEPILF